MGNNRTICALVLSAGYSTRMGGEAKALKKIKGKSLLERISSAFKEAGVEDIITVIGHKASTVQDEATRLGLGSIYNDSFDKGMFSSIKAGIKSIRGKAQALFLSPVDAALFSPYTVEMMLSKHRKNPDKIIIPEFLTKTGHPALIPLKYWEEILNWDKGGGLRAYYADLMGEKEFKIKNSPDFLFLPISDEGILCDTDTPEELREAEAFLSDTCDRRQPSLKEAWDFILNADIGYDKKLHCRMVGIMSARFAEKLVAKGVACSLAVATLAGLLHDSFRFEREHAYYAYEEFMKRGWKETAYAVGTHTSLPREILKYIGSSRTDDFFLSPPWPPDFETDEEKLINTCLCVFMADKFVQDDQIVTVDERFWRIKDYFRTNPSTIRGISNRRAIASEVKSYLSEKIGEDLFSIVTGEEASDYEKSLKKICCPDSIEKDDENFRFKRCKSCS